jgi:translocation and assembly module TamB
VSGTLTASGKSAFARSRTVEAELELAPSHYGEWSADRGRINLRLTGADFAARLGIDGEFDMVGARGPTTSEFRGRIAGTVQGLRFLSGSSRASALRDGRVAANLRVDLEPSRVGQYGISGASLGLTLARGRVNVDGEFESQAGRADLSAHGRPFDPAPSFALDHARFDDVNLSVWTGNRALRSRISGNLTGQGRLDAAPSSNGAWEGTLQLDPSRLGRLDVTSSHARASWTNGEGSLIAVLIAAGDTLSARGQMTTRDGTPRGRADLTVPLGLLAVMAGRDSLKTAGNVTAEVSFAGMKPATAEVDGTIRAQGSAGDLRVDSLIAGLRLRSGTLFLDRLVARSNAGIASGEGRIAMFDTSATATNRMNLTLRVDDASPLRSLLGADTVAVDTASLDLSIHGSGGRRLLDAKGSVRLLAWNDLRLRSAQTVVHAELDSRWRPLKAHADASMQRLRGVGLPILEATAGVDFDQGTTRIDLRAARDESHDLRLVARESSDSLARHVVLESMDVRAGAAAWALSSPTRIDYGRGRVAIDDFDLRSSSGRLHVRGIIDRGGDQDFRVDMKNLGLDLVAALLERPDVTGTLDGSLELSGPAAQPRGNGALDLRLVVAGRAAGTARSRLAWNGTRLDFGGHFASPDADSLTWTGSLPLAFSLVPGDSTRVRVVEGGVDVRFLARQFPLRALSPLLDPKAIGPLDGTLDVDARLKGSSRSITGDGRIEVKHGAVPIHPLDVVYRDIDALATIEGDRVVVRHASVASDKGRIEATGEIRLVSLTRIEPRMHLESRKFVFADAPDLRAILSASLDVTGTLTSPVVRGKASIENSSFTMGPTAAAESGAAIELTEADVRMLEETFGDVSAAPPNAGFLLYDASDLDLDIKLEGNNWIRQNARPKLSVALTGNVHMKKAPHGEPELFGRIAPIPNRGYVEQFARSFDIVGGEVLLNGPMNAHRVDIQAQYKPNSDTESGSDDTVIKLDVQGTIEKLSIVLSSEPAMSEAEIVSYIATGHSPTVDRMGTGSNSNDKNSSLATDIGLSQIAGFAEEPAREAIGLDVLQVRFDAVKGATLVAGRYLDPQLYVGFRQPLQYKETTSPSAGENNRTSVEVEYAVHQWLVLNLQGETSKLRSFIRARHAY